MKAPFNADEIRNAECDELAKERVRANLAASDEWMFRGLGALLLRQTADERQAKTTKYDNDRGFNSADATYLTWAAECVQKFNATPVRSRRFSTPLNAFHTAKVRKKMLKYSGQLARLARASKPAPTPVATVPQLVLVPSVVTGG